jgi:hypothetical protein
VKVADERLEEATMASLADQPEQVLRDRRLAQMCDVPRTIF